MGLEPRLAALADDVRGGRVGAPRPRRSSPTVATETSTADFAPDGRKVRKVSMPGSGPMSEEERRELMAWGRAHHELTEQLGELVGPASPSDDLLLSSGQALVAAEMYLERREE